MTYCFLPQKMKRAKHIEKFLFVFALLTILLSSCSKKNDSSDSDRFSYEVVCDFCDINYVDMSNTLQIVNNNVGTWKYYFDEKVTFDLKISVKTTRSDKQGIHVYILKNEDVVFGDFAFNQADLVFSTKQSKGTGSYGTYQNPGSGSGSNNGGSNGGSGTVSSVCGAKNKTGGYCKRVVVGGGRCWQHK
jgi:uncharacterized membrane protein YgcG